MAGKSSMSSEEFKAAMNGPAGPPPPGVVPNFDNPPNMIGAGIGVLIAFFVLASLALVLRIYTRLFVISQFKASDYSILLGWGFFAGFFVPAYLLNFASPGVDQWNLRLKDYVTLLFYGHIASIMYGMCIFFIKLSILLQYIEIFALEMTSRFMYRTCHSLIWINFAFYFATTFLEIFACRPMARLWNHLVTGTCINIRMHIVPAGSINALSDIIILALPQMIIWKLQVTPQKRIAIAAVFFIGIFACISSLVRLTYSILLFRTNNNAAYYFYLNGFWAIPEISFGIIVACLLVSPKFFRNLKRNAHVRRLSSSIRSLLGRPSVETYETSENREMEYIIIREPRRAT